MNTNEKALALLRSAYEEIQSVEEWGLAMLRACGNESVTLIHNTDSDRYKEFLQTTLIASPADVNWSNNKVCFTNTLSQPEILIQAIERIYQREGSGKNLLTLGCSDMSSNPSAQVCVSRSFESVFPNQNINTLSQNHWRTLLTRLGDDLMLHLLSCRSVYSPVNASCYIQLTGTPLYDLWPFLKNMKIQFPVQIKNCHQKKFRNLRELKKKKLKNQKLKRIVSNACTLEDSDNQSAITHRKRKRGSQASCSGSATRDSVKRQRLSEPWRSGDTRIDLTLWQHQQDLNAAFYEHDMDISDEIAEEHSSHCGDLDQSLYTTAVEFPSHLLNDSGKRCTEGENILEHEETGGHARMESEQAVSQCLSVSKENVTGTSSTTSNNNRHGGLLVCGGLNVKDTLTEGPIKCKMNVLKNATESVCLEMGKREKTCGLSLDIPPSNEVYTTEEVDKSQAHAGLKASPKSGNFKMDKTKEMCDSLKGGGLDEVELLSDGGTNGSFDHGINRSVHSKRDNLEEMEWLNLFGNLNKVKCINNMAVSISKTVTGGSGIVKPTPEKPMVTTDGSVGLVGISNIDSQNDFTDKTRVQPSAEPDSRQLNVFRSSQDKEGGSSMENTVDIESVEGSPVKGTTQLGISKWGHRKRKVQRNCWKTKKSGENIKKADRNSVLGAEIPQTSHDTVSQHYTFQPYLYHTYFHRTTLLFSKNLREKLPRKSVLESSPEDGNAAAKLIVQEIMMCVVAGPHDDENMKQLKCRTLLDERLGKIMKEVISNHRRIKYRSILSQFTRLPKMTSKDHATATESKRGTLHNVEISASKQSQNTEEEGRGEPCISKESTNRLTSHQTGDHDNNHRDFSIQDLLGLHVQTRMVYLFIRRLLKRLLPSQLLCSKKNENVFLKGVQHLLSLGKYEKFCLGEVTSKVKISEIKWLPKKLPHVAKEFLVAKVIFWLMDRYVFAVLKYNMIDSVVYSVQGFFYITDSSVYRNRLFYYRKAIWAQLRKMVIKRYVSGGMLEEVSVVEAKRALSSGQALGHAQLRLLPKHRAVRAIVNLGRKTLAGPNKGFTINGQLQNILHVLTFIQKNKPELMGCSQFGASDIYTTWKKFVMKRREKHDTRPLYFVKVDIENCYDSINQQKLFEIISKNLLQETTFEEYIIRRFSTLHIANRQLKRTFRRDVTILDQFEPDFTRFVKRMCKSRELSGVVFLDQVMHMHETNEHVLQKLRKHLFNNIIQIGRNFYRQQIGISQGSILSTMLCNSYYGNMENKYLRLSSDELLMRQVDDFLLVTPYMDHAKQFLQLMSAGIPEYNCVISKSKSLVNFDIDLPHVSDGQVKQLPVNALFPWCGMLINPGTLEVVIDYTRCSGLKMTDVLTFDLTRKMGRTIEAKLFRAISSKHWLIYLDPDLVKDTTLSLSLFKLFYMLALKFHGYVQKLPPKQGVQENPPFFLNLVTSLPVYLCNNLRMKLQKFVKRHSAVLSQHALCWLCLQAFRTKLWRHTSIYGRHFLKELSRLHREKQRKLSSALVDDFVKVTASVPEEFAFGALY